MNFSLTILLLTGRVEVESFTGQVLSVIDGDSIVVLRGKDEVEVRLEGIDSPEFTQPFGKQTLAQTRDLCLGKRVTVNVMGTDKYDRTLAQVMLPDGNPLQHALVRRGCAWSDRFSTDELVKQLEIEARTQRRGLWSRPEPVAPWEYRAAKREDRQAREDGVQVVANGVEIVGLVPDPKGRDPGQEVIMIANTTTKDVDLRGWKLVDRAGNALSVTGEVERNRRMIIRLSEAISLNNDGDDVLLLDAGGIARSRVSYTAAQVRAGAPIWFEP